MQSIKYLHNYTQINMYEDMLVYLYVVGFKCRYETMLTLFIDLPLRLLADATVQIKIFSFMHNYIRTYIHTNMFVRKMYVN